jgi:uncharacterized membrane protein
MFPPKHNFAFSNSYLMRLFIISPLIALLLFLVTISVLSPYFETRLMVKEFEFASFFLKKICHQYPSRSFYIFGSNIGLCARCFTLYLTLTFYCILFSFFELKLRAKFKWIISISLIIPLLADGLTQYYGLRHSNNFLRFITGVLAGSGLSIIFLNSYLKAATGLLAKLLQGISQKGGTLYESSKL